MKLNIYYIRVTMEHVCSKFCSMTFAAWCFAFQVKLRKSTDAIRFNPKLQKTVNSYKKKSGIGEEHTKITNVSTVEDARSGMWILFWLLKEIHFICKHILGLRCILPTFIRLRECSLNWQELRRSDYFLPQTRCKNMSKVIL